MGYSRPEVSAVEHEEKLDKFSERRIFTVLGVLPEPGGYGVAKFSRSSQPYQKWIMDLTQEGAEKFYETFYFDYGHSSIADLAHVTVIFENISMVAAEELWDEPLIDGQASSTRYQDFEKRGFYVPAEIIGSPLENEYRNLCQKLLSEYRAFLSEVLKFLMERHAWERPADMDDAKYERTLKARAFDVVRYILPMGIRTGLGHILSARTLERRLIELFSHPLIEIREIAQQLKDAAIKKPAFNPVNERLRPLLDELERALPSDSKELSKKIEELAAFDAPSVPTLVKYAERSGSLIKTREAIQKLASELAPRIGEVETRLGAHLSEPGDPETEQVATLLYTALPHSYSQLEKFVADGLSAKERQEILGIPEEHRGKFDPPPFQTRSGYQFLFDLCVDCGAWRDFHRHRRLVQVHKNLDAELGFDTPSDIQASSLKERYEGLMIEAGDLARKIDERYPGAGQYALPFAFRRRSIFKMDAAELQYIAELRTGPENHFSVRDIAYQMYEAFAKRYPRLAKSIRVVHPSKQEFFQR
jgi:thymidylate synthase ThyX